MRRYSHEYSSSAKNVKPTYDPSITASSDSAMRMGGAATTSSSGKAMHTVTMNSANSAGRTLASESPSRRTTTNALANRNTTSMTVPSGTAANPKRTSHGRSNWMESP